MRTAVATLSKEVAVSAEEIQTKRGTEQARLEMRVSADVKKVIEQAASLRGMTVKAYVMHVLSSVAQKDVERSMLTILADRDRDVFLGLLDSNVEPNAALRKAAARYRKEIAKP